MDFWVKQMLEYKIMWVGKRMCIRGVGGGVNKIKTHCTKFSKTKLLKIFISSSKDFLNSKETNS